MNEKIKQIFIPAALLKEDEVAKLIGMSVHWLRRKRWSGGGIPFIKLNDRGAVRYRLEDVELFVVSRSRKSTSDKGIQAIV